jgi:hypothetical protein
MYLLASPRQSVRLHQLENGSTDFHEIWRSCFTNIYRRIQIFDKIWRQSWKPAHVCARGTDSMEHPLISLVIKAIFVTAVTLVAMVTWGIPSHPAKHVATAAIRTTLGWHHTDCTTSYPNVSAQTLTGAGWSSPLQQRNRGFERRSGCSLSCALQRAACRLRSHTERAAGQMMQIAAKNNLLLTSGIKFTRWSAMFMHYVTSHLISSYK